MAAKTGIFTKDPEKTPLFGAKRTRYNTYHGYAGTELNQDHSRTNIRRVSTCTTNLTAIPEIEEEHRKASASSPNIAHYETRKAKAQKSTLKSLRVNFAKKCCVTLVFAGLLSAAGISTTLCFRSFTLSGSGPYVALLITSLWFLVVFWFFALVMKLVLCDRLSLALPSPRWHIVVSGLLLALSLLTLSYTSEPGKTPPYLQAVFATVFFPSFWIIRAIAYSNKGLSRRETACAIALLFGVFMTIIPLILQTSLTSIGITRMDTNGSWYHMVGFILLWLPLGGVFGAMVHFKNKADLLVYIAWLHTFLVGFVVCLFCTNFIPHFGSVATLSEFAVELRHGVTCVFTREQSCADVPWKTAFFIMTYSFVVLICVELLFTADSSCCTTAAAAMGILVCSAFWSLFTDIPNFHWNPFLGDETICLFLGVLVVILCIVMNQSAELSSRQRSCDAKHKTGSIKTVKRLRRNQSASRIEQTFLSPVIKKTKSSPMLVGL